MMLRRVFVADCDLDGEGTSAAIALTDPDARDRVSGWYHHPLPRWLRLNLIASVSGAAAGGDGTSQTLTNRADRLILGVLRGQAEVVLVGAASVRAENFRIPKTAMLAIVTASGDLTGHRLLKGTDPAAGSDAAGRVLVLCPESAVAAVSASVGRLPVEIVALPDAAGRLNLEHVVDRLHARGLNRILCEGGPRLAAQLIEAELVDELCLSTSPRIAGGGLPLLGGGARSEHQVRLLQLAVDDASGIYARWSLRPVELAASGA